MARMSDRPSTTFREQMLNHPTGNLVPIVVEKSGRGERSHDRFSPIAEGPDGSKFCRRGWMTREGQHHHRPAFVPLQ